MTHVIRALNVNEALISGLWWLKVSGVREESRNGPVLVAPGPVITEYTRPTERVLFNAVRDANPVFHLYEALWMLAGGDRAEYLTPFNARMATYAEEDGILHGAYGARWRYHFEHDQLQDAMEELIGDPESRRVVVAMWDPRADLRAQKRDVPCNTHIYFDCRGGKLNMTVCCRSNDAVWGAYGANVVHFSILQEWMAAAVGVPVGIYRQMSNNFHVYTDNPQVQALLQDPGAFNPQYPPTIPLVGPGESAEFFRIECNRLLDLSDDDVYHCRFMRRVAVPMIRAYLGRKKGVPINWDTIDDCDWKVAFQQWVARRDNKEQQK